MGSFENASSAAYTAPVSSVESAPARIPQTTQPARPHGPMKHGMRRDREERAEPQNVSARRAGGRARKRNRNQTAGLPLE